MRFLAALATTARHSEFASDCRRSACRRDLALDFSAAGSPTQRSPTWILFQSTCQAGVDELGTHDRVDDSFRPRVTDVALMINAVTCTC